MSIPEVYKLFAMSDSEVLVQNNVVKFCKSLPSFIKKWRDALQECSDPLKGFINRADQLRHVQKVNNMKGMDDFEEIKKGVTFKILQGIEEEIRTLRKLVDDLNKCTSDFKNKLTALEMSTLQLNWDDEESLLIRGCATQPSLSALLQHALEFCSFFTSALRNINSKLKNVIVSDESGANDLGKAFEVDLENKIVLKLIALTQYVDNENSIV